MKKILRNKGFTLIEMLVAMAIFVTFIGVLISSYTDIVKSQQEANDYRVLYSDARRVFDKLTEEIRNSAIYYPWVIDQDEEPSFNQEYKNKSNMLRLISLDGKRQAVFEHDGDDIWFAEVIDNMPNEYLLMSSDSDGRISVSEFNVFVTPAGDPYREGNVFADGIQFQPKVTVFATFQMERRKGGTPYTLDLQTTVSSRFYTESPTTEFPYTLIKNNE